MPPGLGGAGAQLHPWAQLAPCTVMLERPWPFRQKAASQLAAPAALKEAGILQGGSGESLGSSRQKILGLRSSSGKHQVSVTFTQRRREQLCLGHPGPWHRGAITAKPRVTIALVWGALDAMLKDFSPRISGLEGVVEVTGSTSINKYRLWTLLS